MRRLAGTLMIGGLLLVGCSDDADPPSPTTVEEASSDTMSGSATSGPDTTRGPATDTTRPSDPDPTVRPGAGMTEADLRPMLLSESDLPAGWTAEPEEDVDIDDGAPSCFAEVRRHTAGTEVPHVDAGFTSNQEPLLFQSISYLGEDADARMAQAVGALAGCDDLSLPSPADEGTTATIAPLELPPLGETSASYRMTLESDGVTATIDLVLVQVEDLSVLLALGSELPTPDTAQLEQIARAAVDKVSSAR